MIKVLLVDDSPLALTILKRMLSVSSEIEVVGTALNGKEALKLIPRLDPKVICADIHMPEMDGIELTREVMAKYPRPILVISVSVSHAGSGNIFKMLEAGAIDIFPKPEGEEEISITAPELVRKIMILSGVHVFGRSRRSAPAVSLPKLEFKTIPELIVVGASTGGPQALQEIFSRLPADFPLPIVCIQHISQGFLGQLVDWLSAICKLKVQIAKEGERPKAGNIYFPPEDRHLIFDDGGKFSCSDEPPSNGHRPSVSVTMSSAARVFSDSTVGVVLSGMGNDGADGMREIVRAGGITIAQDEESSVVFGMPKQVIDLGAARYIIPLTEIADALLQLTKGMKISSERGK